VGGTPSTQNPHPQHLRSVLLARREWVSGYIHGGALHCSEHVAPHAMSSGEYSEQKTPSENKAGVISCAMLHLTLHAFKAVVTLDLVASVAFELTAWVIWPCSIHLRSSALRRRTRLVHLSTHNVAVC